MTLREIWAIIDTTGFPKGRRPKVPHASYEGIYKRHRLEKISLGTIAKEFGVSAVRIHQIVKQYEKQLGENKTNESTQDQSN